MGHELLIGIDEAGLGPILGPFCMASFATVHPFNFPIKDSKKLHRKGNLAPLLAACAHYAPGFKMEHFRPADIDILGSLDEPWFKSSAEPIEELGDTLTSFRAATSLSYEHNDTPDQWMHCMSMGVSAFNDLVLQTDSKAEVTSSVLSGLVHKNLAVAEAYERVSFWIDRQGGRRRYGPLVESWGITLNTKDEATPERSRYRGHIGELPVEVNFVVKGDQNHHVIAAASCFAKLRREMAMSSFNHWWTSRIQGLKSTAGYWEDGQRFLKEIDCYREERRINLHALKRNK